MSNFNHKEASQLLNKLYGVPDYLHYNGHEYLYFTQDLGKLTELVLRNGIEINNDLGLGLVEITNYDRPFNKNYFVLYERYSDHNNDLIEANRVAFYKALVKKAGASCGI